MRSHNSGNIHGENLHIWAVERKKTKIYFYKKTTPQLLEHIGLQNIKVGGKTNLGDLPLFVWFMPTLALNNNRGNNYTNSNNNNNYWIDCNPVWRKTQINAITVIICAHIEWHFQGNFFLSRKIRTLYYCRFHLPGKNISNNCNFDNNNNRKNSNNTNNNNNNSSNSTDNDDDNERPMIVTIIIQP